MSFIYSQITATKQIFRFQCVQQFFYVFFFCSIQWIDLDVILKVVAVKQFCMRFQNYLFVWQTISLNIYDQRFVVCFWVNFHDNVLADRIYRLQFVRFRWFQLDKMDNHALRNQPAKRLNIVCTTNDHTVGVVYLFHLPCIFCITEMCCPFCDKVHIVLPIQKYDPP